MVATYLADYIARKNLNASACDIRFGLDPIGACAVWGSSAYNWWEIAPAMTGAIKKLAEQGFKGPFAVADGRIIHDAGGSEVQELTYVLAVAVAYLRALEDANVPLDTARGMIYARLSADADQFLTLAKFRALRLLWARIEQSCGLEPKPLFIAADTAWRMLTQRDPYVNMLRATIATFSAGLGGANAIRVLPHTLALGLPDAFARRAARNTQLILLEESNLAKVADPAAGSGGIENLTQQLCEAAWTQFQDIEKAGGAFPALGNNIIQPKVAATRAARHASIAKRREVLTGASEFPNLHEAPATVLSAEPVVVAPYGKPKIKFDALMPMRLAAPFEKLRDRSDDMLEDHRRAAKNLPRQSRNACRFHRARDVCEELFRDRRHRGHRQRGIFRSFRPRRRLQGIRRAICLPLFSRQGLRRPCRGAAKALHAAGAHHIYLAGRPGELEAALRSAGVQDFIFAGGDALAVLSDAWRRLEQR